MSHGSSNSSRPLPAATPSSAQRRRPGAARGRDGARKRALGAGADGLGSVLDPADAAARRGDAFDHLPGEARGGGLPVGSGAPGPNPAAARTSRASAGPAPGRPSIQRPTSHATVSRSHSFRSIIEPVPPSRPALSRAGTPAPATAWRAQKGEQLPPLLALHPLDVLERRELQPLTETLDPLGRGLRRNGEPAGDLMSWHAVTHPHGEQPVFLAERLLEGRSQALQRR